MGVYNKIYTNYFVESSNQKINLESNSFATYRRATSKTNKEKT